MQNIKNKKGRSSKGTRGDERRKRGQVQRASVELWAEKERKEEEEGKKRMRQKEEEYDELFKRSKLAERSPSKREEKDNGEGDGINELITILKELENDLKEEIADFRKEVRKMKEES